MLSWMTEWHVQITGVELNDLKLQVGSEEAAICYIPQVGSTHVHQSANQIYTNNVWFWTPVLFVFLIHVMLKIRILKRLYFSSYKDFNICFLSMHRLPVKIRVKDAWWVYPWEPSRHPAGSKWTRPSCTTSIKKLQQKTHRWSPHFFSFCVVEWCGTDAILDRS